MGKKKGSILRKTVLLVVLIAFLVGGRAVYVMYQNVYQPNVTLNSATSDYFYVPTGYTADDVTNSLYEQGYIKNRSSFEWVAERKANFKNNIHPGRYLLRDGMTNNELVDLLRSGEQTPVKVTFNNVRTIHELTGKVTKELECDSTSLLKILSHEAFIAKYGFTEHTILTLFLPNTYFFNWNTSAEEVVQRMAKEYKKYWSSERKSKAKKMGLSQSEVAILASIVQAEQSVHVDERPKVAGLYINRLKKGMLLQSDPTVIYGLGDFSLKRVLTKHLEKNTPYNTYIHRGLPPGPINLPSIKSLDAVLNYQTHNYLYMCAKEDFSGYHNFSTTYQQHLLYAGRYREELNRRKIYH